MVRRRQPTSALLTRCRATAPGSFLAQRRSSAQGKCVSSARGLAGQGAVNLHDSRPPPGWTSSEIVTASPLVLACGLRVPSGHDPCTLERANVCTYKGRVQK